MTISLPVPLGHIAPGTAIVCFSLGLMERERVVIGVGFAAAVLALVIMTVASAGAVYPARH